MKQFMALFLPAYSVTLIAVPLALMIDHLGRGATPLRAVAVFPLWGLYTALFALVFVLPGAGLALLFQRFGGGWLHGRAGRLLFTLVCAGLGAAAMSFTLRNYALIAAVSGGTAAWVASSPGLLPHWRRRLVVTMGVAAGLIVGIQYY